MGKFILAFRGLRLAAAIGLALLAASPAVSAADAMTLHKLHDPKADAEAIEKANLDAGTLAAVRPQRYDRRLLVSVPSVEQAAQAAEVSNVPLTRQEISAEGGLIALQATPEGGSTLAEAQNIHLAADAAGKIGITINGELAKENTLNRKALQAENATVITTQRRVRELVGSVINHEGVQEAARLIRDDTGAILLSSAEVTPLDAKPGQVAVTKTAAQVKTEQRGRDGARIIAGLKQRGTPDSAYKVAEVDPDVILDAEAWVEGPL